MKPIQHNFAVNPSVDIPRSKFRMPCNHKFSCDAGWLIPCFWQMVLPGDTINIKHAHFARLSTPLFPLMDNLFVDIQWFFVPTRQYWDNYRKFHGEQNNPGDSVDFTIPQLTGTTVSDADGDLTTNAGRTSALLNYLGIPEGIAPDDVGINAELTRCYAHIYNHWYRDQNLINSVTFDTDDGPDTVTDYMLQRRSKRLDYFTQALPWPQKGDAVNLPLGISAPVNPVTGAKMQMYKSSDNSLITASTGIDSNASARLENDGTNDEIYFKYLTSTNQPDGLLADLSSAIAPTINDIREAFQVQRLLERDARAGTRLPEVLMSHFGVNFYDVSYRPEFLGSSSDLMNITPVPNTTNNVVSSQYTGDLAAYGTSSNVNNQGITKSFVEHGVVMAIFSVRQQQTYQYGLNRFFSHQTRYDTAYPVLANLGEQAVLSKELYVDGTANDEDVYGYVPRYDEYRYNISRISGKFLSESATPLDAWHLSQKHASRPTLGQTFIEENPPIDRVIAIPSEPHMIVDINFDVTCARVLPTYGVPGRIDHF